MTAGQYRLLVFVQIAAVCALGLAAALILLFTVPEYRCRQHLRDAVALYSTGTEIEARKAEEALDRVEATNPRLPVALALRGRIGIERGNPATAADAYEKLEQVLIEQGLPTGQALNGLGCAKLLQADRPGVPREAIIKDAYAKFLSAIQEDRSNGDAHVNAAICCLHLGDLAKSARHLQDARNTRNLSFESVVAYYSAVGCTLARASARGRDVAAAVAREFGDPDTNLAKRGPMLDRATSEFSKALELARGEQAAAELRVNVALVKARRLAWAAFFPLTRATTEEYWADISRALSRDAKLLTPVQQQLLRVVVLISQHRVGYGKESPVLLRQSLPHGSLSPEGNFYAGGALFEMAPSQNSPSESTKLEAEGARYLQAALTGPDLSAHVRLRALDYLAVGSEHARDYAGALKNAREAVALLAQFDAQPGIITRDEQTKVLWNAAVLLCENARLAECADTVRKVLKLDEKHRGARELLSKITKQPTVADVRTMPAAKLPPAMPIVSAVVVAGGPVPLTKEDVQVQIDSKSVTFICGPGNRIYALPRNALAEGKHTVTITVKKDVKIETEFEVTYERQPAKAGAGER